MVSYRAWWLAGCETFQALVAFRALVLQAWVSFRVTVPCGGFPSFGGCLCFGFVSSLLGNQIRNLRICLHLTHVFNLDLVDFLFSTCCLLQMCKIYSIIQYIGI